MMPSNKGHARVRPGVPLALSLCTACGGPPLDLASDGYACPAAARPFALNLVDSVILEENENSLLGNPAITFTAASDGSFFIPDLELNRVSVFIGQGKLLGHLGRSGGGPGEFVSIGTFGLATDSLILQSDGGGARLNIYDTRSREFVGQIPYEGYFSWISAAPQRYVVGLLGSSGVATISPERILAARRGDQQAPLRPASVARPMEYLRYPMLNAWRDLKVVAHEEGVLVVFGGADYLLAVDGAGDVDTVRIPICGRRGVPTARLEQSLRGRPGSSGEESALDTISAVLGLYRLPTHGYLVWFQDPTFRQSGRVFEGIAHLTLLSVDLQRACIDARVEAPGTDRARLAVSGDSVFVLDQVAANGGGGSIHTVVRKYLLDVSTCRWVRIGPSG
jgi:hypothetical protein